MVVMTMARALRGTVQARDRTERPGSGLRGSRSRLHGEDTHARASASLTVTSSPGGVAVAMTATLAGLQGRKGRPHAGGRSAPRASVVAQPRPGRGGRPDLGKAARPAWHEMPRDWPPRPRTSPSRDSI